MLEEIFRTFLEEYGENHDCSRYDWCGTVLLEEKPDALLVHGDASTTLAGALATSKLHISVVHGGTGIRILPKTMPEEINQILTIMSHRYFVATQKRKSYPRGVKA